MSITNKDQVDKKIMLMGLDNSGKSSILLSFRDDTNLLSFLSLKPTRGVDKKIFNIPQSNMIVWEFGGQDQYRQEYLAHFDRYFDEVDNIIYIIDIQDIDRHELSLHYFKEIIDLLKQNNMIVDISIYFHKFDPNLTKQEKFENVDTLTTPYLVTKIRQIIPSDYKYKFYKTSIYTVFDTILITTSDDN